LRLTLFITRLSADSLFGEATVYLNPEEPLDNRPCAKLGARIMTNSAINIIIFTTDEPGADLVFDGQLGNGRISIRSLRPRNGTNVLQPGVELTFVHRSEDPRRVGCLTSA